jgi:hypothetical protein
MALLRKIPSHNNREISINWIASPSHPIRLCVRDNACEYNLLIDAMSYAYLDALG